jgi:acyl carrier protein
MSDLVHDEVLKAVHGIFNTKADPALMKRVSSGEFAFADLGGDSVDAMDFCFQIEEALGIEIEMSDLEDFPTSTAFCTMLRDRLGKAA